MHQKQSIPRSKSIAWSAQITGEIFALLKSNLRSAQTTKVFLVLKATRVPKKSLACSRQTTTAFLVLAKSTAHWMDQIIPIRNVVYEALWAGGSVGKKLFSFWLSLAVFINNFIVKENLLKKTRTNRMTHEYIRRLVSSRGIGQPLGSGYF